MANRCRQDMLVFQPRILQTSLNKSSAVIFDRFPWDMGSDRHIKNHHPVRELDQRGEAKWASLLVNRLALGLDEIIWGRRPRAVRMFQ